MKNLFNRLNNKNNNEIKILNDLIKLYRESPIPEKEKLENIFLYLQKKDLAHLLFMNELYKKIINIHGNIFEFGTRWGRNVSLFTSLRGIYEPYNHTRKIVAFDTFSGFPNTSKKDGAHSSVKKGSYKVSPNYDTYLNKLLSVKEQELPINHIKKFQVVKGDVSKTSHKYFNDNKESLIAMAFFDLDLFEPTKEALKAILPRMSRGSIIVFDELNHSAYPGETLAYLEIFKKDKYHLERLPYSASKSFIVL
tara:strand:- start:155 stop:907 length:753 start_codon:yes stop_codon:yes gene_type:complete